MSAVILGPKKTQSVTVSIVSPSICHEVMVPDDSVTIFLIVLGLFFVGLSLLLCFLPGEVPLAFVVKLFCWC